MDKSCAGPLPRSVLGLASAVELTHTSFSDFLSAVPSFPEHPFSSCPTTFHYHIAHCTCSPLTCSSHTDPWSGCTVSYCASYHPQNQWGYWAGHTRPDCKGQNSSEKKVEDVVMSHPAFLCSHVLPPVAMTQPIRSTQPFFHLFSHQSLIICAINPACH